MWGKFSIVTDVRTPIPSTMQTYMISYMQCMPDGDSSFIRKPHVSWRDIAFFIKNGWSDLNCWFHLCIPRVDLANLQTGISSIGYLRLTPKNTLSLTENPRIYFPKSKTLKISLWYTIHLVKLKHDMIMMKICVDWSAFWIKLYPTKYYWKSTTLKLQHLFSNPKRTAVATSTQKIKNS